MSSLNKKILVSGFFVISFLVFQALPVQAALVPCNGLDCEVKDLFGLIVGIYNFLLGLAGLVALLVIIFGGIKMIISHLGVGDSPEGSLESGKEYVKGGIVGLIIIACAYLIVNTLIAVLGGGGIRNIIDNAGLGAWL